VVTIFFVVVGICVVGALEILVMLVLNFVRLARFVRHELFPQHFIIERRFFLDAAVLNFWIKFSRAVY
jgi:hypothetical protein